MKYEGYSAVGSLIPIYEEVSTHPNIKGELTVADWISDYFSEYIIIKPPSVPELAERQQQLLSKTGHGDPPGR